MCHERPFVERPNCSSTSAHSTWLQPWPPCSTACRPPFRRAASAARRIASTSAGGQHAAGALGHLLARDQHVVDEPPRALLQLGLGRRSTRPRPGSRSASPASLRHVRAPAVRRSRRRPPPGSPSSRPAWLLHHLAHDRRRRARPPGSALRAPRPRRAPPPRAATRGTTARCRAGRAPRRARPRARRRRVAAAPPAVADRSTAIAAGSSRSGSGCQREPRPRRGPHTHVAVDATMP